MICWKNCFFYIQQNIVDLKIIWYKVFTFNFGFKISGDQTRRFFWTHSSTFVNVALSYEKWLTCFSQWTQIGDKECYKLLSYIISYTVKMLRLTVTSRLGTFWKGGRVGQGHLENCVHLLKNPGYAPVVLANCSMLKRQALTLTYFTPWSVPMAERGILVLSSDVRRPVASSLRQKISNEKWNLCTWR